MNSSAPLQENGIPARAGLDTVVLGTDFSRDAETALQRATLLPFRRGGLLALIHVLPPLGNRAADSVVRGAAEQRLEESRVRLLAGLQRRGRADLTVASRLIRGSAPAEIGRLAEQMDADLILLGRRGRRTLRERLLGSVAERVARHARRPVLVVARPPKGPYRTIVLGFDLSPDAKRATRFAARLASPSASFTVIHAYLPPFDMLPGSVAGLGRSVAPHVATESEIRRALPQPPADRDAWRVIVRGGDPRQLILEATKGGRGELIALGSEGRTGLARRLIGSVAEGVLHQASVDVLIVPRP
jgi:nucleotide-binding universal stress UspA family protein